MLLANVASPGTYLSDGPAFFIATERRRRAGDHVDRHASDAPAKVGAQQGSEAYWKLVGELGADGVTAYPTLREAHSTRLTTGEVPVVAGDALVGAYIARDCPNVHFAGQIEPARLLGVAVCPDNAKLADAVRTTLDGLAADGVLDAIRGKWVGALPKLKLPSAAMRRESRPPERRTP